MGSNMYKWEDNGGLKHHCPICQTPLSHDKCRTQCLGVHVEWCNRYHALFRKNWSSRCSACKTTDDQHDKRHREIAELVLAINKLKADEDTAAMRPATPKTPLTPLTARALKTVDGMSSDLIPKTTKKERKQLKKAVKAMGRDKVVTSADILFVANTLHPESDQEGDEDDVEDAELAEDADIRMNLKFNNSTCNTKTARHDFIKKESYVDVEKTKVEVERILAVFEMNKKAAGEEGRLIAELVAAIQVDLIHHHDELRTTKIVRNGFWRWATKKAYREFLENGKDWNLHLPGRAIAELPAENDAENETNAVEAEEDEEPERNGSVDSSLGANSASTSVTVPSIKPSSAKKPKTLTIAVPPKEQEVVGHDPGWKQVGKKVLKTPVTAKLKMVKNNGLHHLAQTPKGSYGALTEAWTGPVDEDGKRLP